MKMMIPSRRLDNREISHDWAGHDEMQESGLEALNVKGPIRGGSRQLEGRIESPGTQGTSKLAWIWAHCQRSGSAS